MKKFKFSLEDVLKYRKFLQERAELELGKARMKEAEFERKLEDVAKKHFTATQKAKGLADFNDIHSVSNYYELLNQQKENYLNELSKAKIITEEKRKLLQEAMKKTESLKKLKEKEFSKYKELESREEDDFLDEINSHSNIFS